MRIIRWYKCTQIPKNRKSLQYRALQYGSGDPVALRKENSIEFSFFVLSCPTFGLLEWERNACYQTKKREDLSFFSFVPPQGRAFIASGGAVSGIFVSNSPRSLTFLSIV